MAPAGLKLPAVALALCLIALSLSSTVSAADAAPAAPKSSFKLPHPLGSGQNHVVSLGFQPKRGRRFWNLMKKFVDAARQGDLPLAQKLQQQLFAITKQVGGGRHLLQAARDTCPQLPGTLIDTANPPLAGTAASGDATTITPPATAATGPLPTIRFATLEPCAEFGCRRRFSLARRPDGTVFCRDSNPTGAPGPVAVEDFAYFPVYDYDKLWDTDADNVIAGLYAGGVVTNENAITSQRGALGATTGLGLDGQVRAMPAPFLGIRADGAANAQASTGVEVSKAVGDVGVLKFSTKLPVLSAGATLGVVLPGTAVADRKGDASDNNVALRTNNPALYAFGKKH